MPDKEKSTGILDVLRAFLTLYGVDKRLFEAFYHYGALPNGRRILYANVGWDQGPALH